MKFLLGTKENMTEIFEDNGKVEPVTVVSVGPTIVTQVKTVEKDGYEAVQIGFGEMKESRMTKSEKGHLKDLGNFRFLKEFRMSGTTQFKVGDKIDANVFVKGDGIQVSGISKGKGFQGVVKRHGFAGGSRTHGQKHSEREPGAIGGGARAGGRVAKGMRMAGRMGGDRVTVRGLEIVRVDAENNKVYIRGAVPGKRGTLLEIISA
ncbi:MAG: 50S ribosomal protein L3 [Candidatus Paceibacterota bacterium]